MDGNCVYNPDAVSNPSAGLLGAVRSHAPVVRRGTAAVSFKPGNAYERGIVLKNEDGYNMGYVPHEILSHIEPHPEERVRYETTTVLITASRMTAGSGSETVAA